MQVQECYYNKIVSIEEQLAETRTFNKMQWGVCAFNEWCNQKMFNEKNYDVCVYESDLHKVESFSKESLKNTMCMFIPEVTKVKDD